MSTVSKWKDLLSMVLLLLCAVGAFASFFLNLTTVTEAEPIRKVGEIWRLYGFLVFTGLFLLLAFFPRRYAGIWELTIFHKAAVAVTVPLLINKITPDIQTVFLTDGIVAVILFISYLLTKGYRAWKSTSK
ncbi:hypothetical protein SAMN05444392_10359 [Seinonella peptonophila]|uniref:Uncharacterized protein n=1 Tax=Seinonella peptonophila TaxID=112248 RepID=A0A1M4W6F8_9BACL|nr:hypothetical protein [Seinonella peptonophila]SHE76787.1 hypothetical protein SAMN05444392_10359 [Seinonella peptonophila]